jgi:hypothetical protein
MKRSKDGCNNGGWCDSRGLDHWNVHCPDCGNRYNSARFLKAHQRRLPVTKRARQMYRARVGR